MLQGERPLAKDNRTLGRFHLMGLPPAPRGEPQIEVTFDVDSNGIVNVSAKDLATGKEQKITVTASSGLNKQDVDRMVKEAQSHAAEDQQRKALIDARNEADALAYSVEKTARGDPAAGAAGGAPARRIGACRSCARCCRPATCRPSRSAPTICGERRRRWRSLSIGRRRTRARATAQSRHALRRRRRGRHRRRAGGITKKLRPSTNRL